MFIVNGVSEKGACSMNKHNSLSVKGLFALAVCVLLLIALPLSRTGTSAEIASGEETTSEYRYAVSIEFGALTFYYDYGDWDVNSMRYISDDSSKWPAADTVEGFPGWYGFDGSANRISVKYSNTSDETVNQGINVTLSYRQLSSSEGVIVDGVEMTLFSDSGFRKAVSPSFNVPNTSAESEEKTTVYFSLSGEPSENGEKFLSEAYSPIGMLTITIGDFTD